MIDPKELNQGGGGGQQEQKKYYNHYITLSGGEATCNFTITNSRPEPYTKVSDIYSYFATSSSTIGISATGNYNGASGKGIVYKFTIQSPSGNSIVSFTKLEIEDVENVPTIKTTGMAVSVYFRTIYEDEVIEL